MHAVICLGTPSVATGGFSTEDIVEHARAATCCKVDRHQCGGSGQIEAGSVQGGDFAVALE